LLCHAITQALDGIDVPMAIGLRSGHVSRQNVTLTFGAQAELEVDSDVRLTLLDPVVHP
jgi:muramoyltetrapeptide carboxypeptidase